VFCARFVARMHSLGTPFFSTLQYYDRVLKDLRQLVFAATEHEAAHLGRFLYESLAQLAAWRADEATYARECASQPGFGSSFLDRDSRRATFADFVAVSLKWHQKVVRSLVACLESKEYMEIRNALLVLTRVSRAFPATRKHGAYLEKRVAKIKSDDPREDLKTLAGRYYAILQKERPSWVSDEEFAWAGPGRFVPPKPPPPAPTPKAEAPPPKAEVKAEAKPRPEAAKGGSMKEEKPPLAEAARDASRS
jgi:THO complex subunit 2